MMSAIKHVTLDGLPSKTAWTAFWFVLLGGAALFADRTWFRTGGPGQGDGEAEAVETAGVGPLPTVAPVQTEFTDKGSDTGVVGARTAAAPGGNSLSAQAPQEPHQPIEDPNGAAMIGFYKALESFDRLRTRSTVRVMHYGDSILTTDKLSGQVRRILQHKFGDGGHGFILMGKPWTWYNRVGARNGAYGEWEVHPVTLGTLPDGLYGLGAVAFESSKRNAVAWVGTSKDGDIGRRVASFDVSYLERPRGGSFELFVNGELSMVIKTASAAKGVAHRRIDVQPGSAVLKLRTVGDGAVRVFGAVMESDQKGIVYDTLAINGARMSNMNRINKEHWRSELKQRNADLVLLMFGANEGHNESLSLDEYRRQLAEVIRTIREGAPDRSCMVIGPMDQAVKLDSGALGSRLMPAKLSAAQREVALKEGCAFFDTYTAMGGRNSMARWLKKGWGGGDLVHPTDDGARQIGSWIAEALLAGYQRFLYCGGRCE